MVDAHVSGRWFLNRDDGAFCEAATINKLCSVGTPCPSGTPCVRYEAVAGKPFTPTPTPAETPDDGIRAEFQRVVLDRLDVSLLGAPKTGEEMTVLQLARSQNRRWVAGVVAMKPGEVGSGGEGPFLVVASRECADGITVCDPRVIELATPPLNREPAFHDDQVRFLTHDPDGGATDDSGLGRSAVLWVAGLSRSSCCDPVTPVRVGRVLLENADYDALAESPRGGTVYLAPGGRCFEQDAMLLVPSFCRPAERDCPDGAECRPRPVAVAIDLRTDLNEDGIPDSLQQRGQ